jgi:hypothetical protein
MRIRTYVFCSAALAAVANLTVTAETADAASCNLSGRSLLYTVRLCSRNGCKMGRERITVVGNKALRFDTPNQPVGETYIIGRTVDLCDTQYGTGKDCHPIDRRLRITSTGTASYDRGNLTLKNDLTVYANNAPSGSFSMTIVIRALEPQCTFCQVIDLRMRSTNGDDWQLSDSPSCEIVPN